MEDKDTREFDDKDTEVVDAQVIEPPQDADDNDDEYEKVCFVCHRPESVAGKMINLPNNMCVCNDCMQKRNRYMVDKADMVIAVWNGSPSGTGKTVAYAKEQGKPVLMIDPESL